MSWDLLWAHIFATQEILIRSKLTTQKELDQLESKQLAAIDQWHAKQEEEQAIEKQQSEIRYPRLAEGTSEPQEESKSP